MPAKPAPQPGDPKRVSPWFPATSNAANGAVVPMPTLVVACALLMPMMLPRTSELLAVTSALAPIAVALLRLFCAPGLLFAPTKVLLEPVVDPPSGGLPA